MSAPLGRAWRFFAFKEGRKGGEAYGETKGEANWGRGDAFFIIGKVRKALLKAGLAEEAERFVKEATAGDYDHLLRVVMDYVDVE